MRLTCLEVRLNVTRDRECEILVTLHMMFTQHIIYNQIVIYGFRHAGSTLASLDWPTGPSLDRVSKAVKSKDPIFAAHTSQCIEVRTTRLLYKIKAPFGPPSSKRVALDFSPSSSPGPALALEVGSEDMYLSSAPHQNEPLPSPIITTNEYNIYTRLRSTISRSS